MAVASYVLSPFSLLPSLPPILPRTLWRFRCGIDLSSSPSPLPPPPPALLFTGNVPTPMKLATCDTMTAKDPAWRDDHSTVSTRTRRGAVYVRALLVAVRPAEAASEDDGRDRRRCIEVRK